MANSIYPTTSTYADSSPLRCSNVVPWNNANTASCVATARSAGSTTSASSAARARRTMPMVVGIAEDITDKEAHGERAATAGHHRRADPEQQPSLFLRQCRGRPSRSVAARGYRWRSCCWTSMISRRSTTASATRSSGPPKRIAQSGSAPLQAVATCSGGSAARSSPCCCPAATSETARQIGERLQREVQRLRFQEGRAQLRDHRQPGPDGPPGR